jgi:hypothetical protein
MDSDMLEEFTRRVGIITEGLRSDMRIVAEGQDLLRESLERKLDGIAQIGQLTYAEVTGRPNDHEARLRALERRQS